MSNTLYPINPFPDISPTDFNKLNKKNVTEDFVEENFKELKWEVYKPFNDTGIDRIAIKFVCPNGHTKINETIKGNCPICKSKPVRIIRYIQVKTRELKNDIFGFTIKSKDVRIDPRHTFVLYSDKTNNNQQDFLIISIKELLSFFYDNCPGVFASLSFRKGNNKLNSLKYKSDLNKWFWGQKDWEKYRNQNGMTLIQNSEFDLNIDKNIKETRELSDKLIYKFSAGRSYNPCFEDIINNNLALPKPSKEIIYKSRQKIKTYLKDNCDNGTYNSMEKYFEYIKQKENLGEEDE